MNELVQHFIDKGWIFTVRVDQNGCFAAVTNPTGFVISATDQDIDICLDDFEEQLTNFDFAEPIPVMNDVNEEQSADVAEENQ